MDDATLKTRVNRLLKDMGEPRIRQDELNHALAQRWFGDYDLETEATDLVEMVAEHCREWRTAPVGRAESRAPDARGSQVRGTRPQEPPWWDLQVSRIWARYEPERREMSALFGLPDRDDQSGIFAVEELPELFDEVANTERSEGDWLLLDVPLWSEEEGDFEDELWPVWRGFHRPPPISRDGSVRETTAAERASEQKLYRLAETARRIADETGCLPYEAVVFLLCGERLAIPYVDVVFDPRYRGYVIVVRDRRIPVKDVAAEYRYCLDTLGPLARQPQEGPYLVAQFVEETWAAEPRLPWPQLYERFNEAHPGRYVSMKSFRQTYYSKRSKQKGK